MREPALLSIRGLRIELPVEGELRDVVRDVSLELDANEALGLVGESGSGKSMTARSILGLLPRGARASGAVVFDGADVLELRRDALRRYRSRDVAMVHQDPRAHVNPVRTIGDFLTEGMRTNLGVARRDAERRARELLDAVGIGEPARRLRQHPHELSGGMLQRVVIAAALAGEPRLLIADEPTTALDVTTQSEVMAILDELRRERGMALLMITHDLDLAAAVCDRTAVMYAGAIVEEQASAQLHDDPAHPYTAALVDSRPQLERTSARLRAVPGRPVSAFDAPAGCAFAPRCRHAEEACAATRPALEPVAGGRAACLRAAELRGRLADHESGAFRA